MINISDSFYNTFNNNNNLGFIKNIKYKIFKDNLSYFLNVSIEAEQIIFKIMNYELKLNKQEFSNLIHIDFKSLDEAFQFIINTVSQHNIIIKEVLINKIINININLKERDNIDLILIYKNINKDFIINEICNEYKNKYISLKEEIDKLNMELTKIKNEKVHLQLNQLNHINNKSIEKPDKDKNEKLINHLIKTIDFNKFKLKYELSKNSYCQVINNTFTIFNSINNILYIIYSTIDKSIISYNLISQKISIEIKNAHNNFITNFRHYFDKKNKKDIIMSISDLDNHLKVWDANKWICLLIIEKVNKQGFLNSACFLNENDNIHIVTSNWNFQNIEGIKIFNIKGDKLKEINNSNDKTVYIKSYYDIKELKYYIITGNGGFIKSYDYLENKIYHIYSKKNVNNCYYCVIVNYFKNILKIIGSCFEGYIIIWDFHIGNILNIIHVEKGLIGICVWDDKYLFCGNNSKNLNVIDIEKELIINKYIGLNNILCTVKKINHPRYGESIVTQGLLNDQIKLWNFEKM